MYERSIAVFNFDFHGSTLSESVATASCDKLKCAYRISMTHMLLKPSSCIGAGGFLFLLPETKHIFASRNYWRDFAELRGFLCVSNTAHLGRSGTEATPEAPGGSGSYCAIFHLTASFTLWKLKLAETIRGNYSLIQMLLSLHSRQNHFSTKNNWCKHFLTQEEPRAFASKHTIERHR